MSMPFGVIDGLVLGFSGLVIVFNICSDHLLDKLGYSVLEFSILMFLSYSFRF